MQESTDEILVHAARKGDDGAFSCLVTRYKRRVFGLAARFAKDSDELEDICQEVFIKAYENLNSYRGDAPFEHWLMRIAAHASYDVLRKRRRESGTSSYDDLVQGVADQGADARHEARQARNLLKWALSRLSPDERMIITLLELEEYSIKETAALTGWSEANVKVRGHRARQALKRLLEEHNAR
jgi:RNA polymerase sigma-70 factor (ECF subfamily)